MPISVSIALAQQFTWRILRFIQGRREPQQGPGKQIDLFKLVHSGVLYISERQQGPRTSRDEG